MTNRSSLQAGSESRRSLGLAVVGGLLVSQLMTLYITPVIYYYLDRIQAAVKERLFGYKKQETTYREPEVS